ncbi:tRNA (adenosine(37)-N6)-dimethylallyltransferase MiaA [Desulfuromonas sp. AOP6]|uniref:tRNA (adenosine(37)-N6)-dimethylallyltransferase MiaA n=1 Tax=Desulfuromonas sp. AOP6 TaxID=1566351 RepID=UPI00127AE3A7|nr:tRNA (adenosine(37)-N6)-dimethylallyltransferase MiaA [Desulfuromonas sp. AOP6]BCA80959.1 tRNA dimethylallyltransferase 2 [Desulfuromonas sp. AOP6]
MPFNLIVILGPTASGKTRLGVEVARALGGEILSADSRQVYTGMDIGTGKDLQEYGEVPYHLIDLVPPGHEFNVFEFQRRFYQAFVDISERGALPILVGGTGLYLDAVLRGYRLVEVPENPVLRRQLAGFPTEALQQRLLALRPQQHNSTDLEDRDRLIRAIEIAEGELAAAAELPPPPDIRPLIFGVRWPREVLRQRITRRLRERLEQGLIEEVEGLRLAGVPFETLEFYGLEYRFVAQFLQGELRRNDMVQKLNSAIHQFAKRQETWFRRMERQGTAIHWVDGGETATAAILQRIGDAGV